MATRISGMPTRSECAIQESGQTKIADHAFSSGVGIDFGGGVECVERAGGIDDGRAGIDGDRKRYEFAGLFIEVTGLLAGPAEGGVALDDMGLSLPKPPTPARSCCR